MVLLQSYELNWIVAFQGKGQFQLIMIWLSYLGSEAFSYALPFTYFVLSRRTGARLYLLLSISGALLDSLKTAFHAARPYWVDVRVKALSGSGSYSMPSGHVLAASLVWPLIARAIGKRWICALSLAMVLVVSASRVYLGVHFISDVVAAWIIGACLLRSFDWIERQYSKWIFSRDLLWQVGAIVLSTVVLLATGIVVRVLMAKVPDPSSWANFSRSARDLGGFFHSSGEFFGAATGIALAERWARFEAIGSLWKRGFAFGYTVIVAWLLQKCSLWLPTFDYETIRLLYEFGRGATLSLWTLLLAPWLLKKMNVLCIVDVQLPTPITPTLTTR
jgi:membrane-associated phospholipid phosphatase